MNRILSLIGVVLVVGCGSEPEPPDAGEPTLQIDANTVELRLLSVAPEGRYVDDAGLPYTGQVFSRDYTRWETRTDTVYRSDENYVRAYNVCEARRNSCITDSCFEQSMVCYMRLPAQQSRVSYRNLAPVKVGELRCWDFEFLPKLGKTSSDDRCTSQMQTDDFDPEAIRFVGYLVEGGLDGPYERYYENGQLYRKGSFKDGERDGPYERYYENGQLYRKGTYKDGERDGPYERYFLGELREKGTFKDNEKCGEWFEEGETVTEEGKTVTHDPCPPS